MKRTWYWRSMPVRQATCPAVMIKDRVIRYPEPSRTGADRAEDRISATLVQSAMP
ncbi:hypothetical protein AB0I51_46520 [Streptomyces sp. NPDC050549]|uniref:hypothetical protein n=1 Tax=Streptomyces sp. NPDC050549 TaxID=3155406 RepID=UPI00343CDF5E